MNSRTLQMRRGGGALYLFPRITTLPQIRDVDNRQYVMFYVAVAADNSRSLGMAVSKDGMKDWQRCPQPVLRPGVAHGDGSGPSACWDSGSVGQPCAVSMSKGRWRLYYAGRQGNSGAFDGFGMALSTAESSHFQGMPMEFKRREHALA